VVWCGVVGLGFVGGGFGVWGKKAGGGMERKKGGGGNERKKRGGGMKRKEPRKIWLFASSVHFLSCPVLSCPILNLSSPSK